MREFYWDYFSRTGSIEAYLLYKDKDELQEDDYWMDDEPDHANEG